MSDRAPKKPTGTTGPVKVSSEGSEFLELHFPDGKEEIEAFVAAGYVRIADSLGASELVIERQNRTDDLDFSIKLDGEPGYLELAEVAPLHKNGEKYEHASPSYDVYRFAEQVRLVIEKKGSRYQGATTRPIVLLLYTTDWKFVPSESSLELLRYWMRGGYHGFERIDWYCPIMEDEGVGFVVFPSVDRDWSRFRPERFRGRKVTNIDLRPSND